MRTHLRLATVLAVMVLAAACGMSSEGPETPTGSPTPSAPGGSPGSPDPTPSVETSSPEDLRAQPRVAAAIDDTARREGVDPGLVSIAAWSPVEWSDGSLGCPKPGMVYTQAVEPGELLILRVGSGLYQYHARTGGTFTYCEDPTAGYAVTE